MEAMDKRKKGRLIKNIIFNVIVIISCSIYMNDYMLPKYDELSTLVGTINATQSEFTHLKNDGVKNDSFTKLLNTSGRNKDIPSSVFSDTEKLDKVLAKPATASNKDYLSWLVEENGKMNTFDKEIQGNEKILGNIIPVFLNSSTINTESDIENQITLVNFISYIEKEILSKYSLTSYIPLGLSNIRFSDKKDTPVNIGSFKIDMDFKAKNSDIIRFINSIQQSGKFTIRNGKIFSETNGDNTSSKDKGLSNLSNLLINIDSFSLASIPVLPNQENTGRVTLQFYVEGMNYQKILILRSLLTTKFESLQKSIKEKGNLCAKWWNALCNETETINAITAIKGLIKNITALQPRIDSFKVWNINVDVNSEMDILTDLKMSLQTIEMVYTRNNSILEKIKK